MATNGNHAGISFARPVFKLAGQANGLLTDRLLELVIIETSSGLYRCEASFSNWGSKDNDVSFLYFDRDTVDFGKAFTVSFGDDQVFEGRIMGLEAAYPEGGTPMLTILAEDRFQDLRMTRRTRVFEEMSDSDVFNQIANDHSLTPSVSISGSSHKVLAQVNQSDLAFLRERARALDAEVWVNGMTLNAKSHSARDEGSVELGYKGDLLEFSVLADLAHQRTSVIVSGWDVSGKSALKHEAEDSVLSSELNGDTSGVSILKSALGARKENVAHTVPLTSDDAQAQAEAYFKMSARRFVVGHGTAVGNAKLRVGAKVDLKNLGPLFSGKYYLTEVRHVFSGLGLRSEFVGERPGIGQA
jgi:phage protein D